MSTLGLGELCAGYGGLGLAVEQVFNATTAWFSEYDAAPSKILAHHWPSVPNYGDMTKIDWAAIEPVDIISGGTPCQDLSAAGRRAGMTEGTRSNLWVQMREAIATQRPRYVVWENVRGAYSATAASDLEQCPGCLGDTGDGGTVLRALGRVLGDLSDLGYDCQWRGLRAADVGACHGRFRVFVLAQNTNIAARSERRQPAPGQAEDGRAWAHPGGRNRTPAADTNNPGWGEQRRTQSVQPEHATTEHEGPDAPDAESLGRGKGWAEPAREQRGLAAAGDSSPAADAITRNAMRGGSGRRATEPEQARSDNATLGSGAGATTADDSGTAWRGPEQPHLSTPAGSAAELGERAGSDIAGADGNIGGVVSVGSSETRSTEELQGVREAAGAQAIRYASGGSDAIPGTGTLRPVVREQSGGDSGRLAPLAGQTDQAARQVRGVWRLEESSCSPQGQEPGEQLTGELGSPLRKLPSETPLVGGPEESPRSETNWGPYEPAIRRWEMVLGRQAPAPTEATGRNGGHRLSPRFTEFMMGLPDGWVTDPAIGITRNEQLKACGNGVVPQQAVAALSDMLAAFHELGVAA